MREAGEEALTALGLAFPIQLFMVAVAVGTGVGINVLLARSMGQGNQEIMIYGWLGCPEMGVRGAAYATVIGQIASAALAFFFHIRLDSEIENRVLYLKPSASPLSSGKSMSSDSRPSFRRLFLRS